MNALTILALWYLDATTSPTQPDERDAVAHLRFEAAIRLPPDERQRLFRMLWQPDYLAESGHDRQEGSKWLH